MKTAKLIFPVFIFFFSVSFSFSLKAQSLKLEKLPLNTLSLKPLVFVDSKKSFNFNSFLSGKNKNLFTLPPKENLSFGYTKDRIWVYFKIEFTEQNPEKWFLEIKNPLLDSLELQIISPNKEISILKGGDLGSFLVREIKHRHFIFPLEFEKKGFYEVYLKVETSSSMQIPLILWPQNDFFEASLIEYILFGLYFGLLLVMAIYNLLLYSSTREAMHLLYSGYVFSFLVWQLSTGGFLYQFILPDFPNLCNQILIVSISLVLLLFNSFTSQILNLRENLPKVQKGFQGLLYLLSVLTVVLIFFPFSKSLLILASLGSILCLFWFFTGVIAWRKNIPLSDYYSVCWLFLLSGGLIFGLNRLAIIEANLFTEYALRIGSSLEITLFSYILAHRFNILKKNSEILAQKAEAANDAKDQFLANISHELRTPLNAIMGMHELLSRTPMNPKQMENLNILKQSSNHLLSLVEDVLDFSQFEKGNTKFYTESFDLKQNLKDLLVTFGPKADRKRIDLSLDYAENIESFINFDKKRLWQVISNLIDNAIKFTRMGEVVIKVEKHNFSKNGLKILVIDTGIGIPSDLNQDIFEKFVKSDYQDDYNQQGTGIGLSICKKLVELWGGEIGVESQLAKGSKFWFTL